jgi:hypothetical protein
VVDIAVQEVADVGHHGDLRMDQGVLPAEAANLEARRFEGRPGVYGVDPVRCFRGFLAQVIRDARRGKNHEVPVVLQSSHHSGNVDVVAVFVGDQDRFGTAQCLRRFRKRARVQHQNPAVFLESDAGVGVFGQLHSASLGSGPNPCPRSSGW